MALKDWKSVRNPIGCSHKWRREKDNAFLEISASTAYGCRGGYVVVLWANKSRKPYAVAGAETKTIALKKAKSYMRTH